MNVSKEIARALNDSGIIQGDSILIHSAFSSLGARGKAAPDKVIEGLRIAVGEEGNVLFPALSFGYVTADNPVFDVEITKSCIGFLPEYFRKNYASSRSLNPTHSVCGVGKDIEYLLQDHVRDDSPLGKNSPFRRLKDKKGKILMVGCGLGPNTFMHAVEEQAEPAYSRCGRLLFKIIDRKNNVIRKPMCTHALRHFTFQQKYEKITAVMPPDGLIRTYVLSAETYIISADILWDAALGVMAGNPCFFADKIEETRPG